MQLSKSVHGKHLFVHVCMLLSAVTHNRQPEHASALVGVHAQVGAMAEAADNFQHVFKILLIGDTGVGKSALLLRFTQDR